MQIRAPVQGCRVLRPAAAPRAALRLLAKRRSSRAGSAEEHQTSEPSQARPTSSDAALLLVESELSNQREDESEQAAWRTELESTHLKSTPSESSTQYKVGDVALGVVTGVQPYGAFIDLGEGVTGLLHISQIKKQRFDSVDSVMRKGDEIKVVIHSVDDETGRIALSTRTEQPSIPEGMEVGDVVLGVVQDIRFYGVLVDVGNGVTGLLHISQVSHNRIAKGRLSELFEKGDEFKVMICNLDGERGRIALSTKQLEPLKRDLKNNRQRHRISAPPELFNEHA